MAAYSVLTSEASERASGCDRCGGLVVADSVFANRDETDNVWLLVGRCVNCGWIDEPVIRANRLHPTAPERPASYKRRSGKRRTEGESNLSRTLDGQR